MGQWDRTRLRSIRRFSRSTFAVRSLRFSFVFFFSFSFLPPQLSVSDLEIMAQPDMSLFGRANQAASFLKGRLPEGLRNPQVAIVCGSGLGGLADTVHAEPRAEYDYSSVPYFPLPTGETLTIPT